MPNPPLQSEADFFGWMLKHNLDHIVRFHNGLQALLGEKLDAPKAVDDPMLRSTIELYDKMNSANSLLVALGFLEEMLVLFWRRQFPGEDIPNGRSSIERYQRLLDALGLNLGTMPAWSVLRDATKIRHCLLHANGRISLMKRPPRTRFGRASSGIPTRSRNISIESSSPHTSSRSALSRYGN